MSCLAALHIEKNQAKTAQSNVHCNLPLDLILIRTDDVRNNKLFHFAGGCQKAQFNIITLVLRLRGPCNTDTLGIYSKSVHYLRAREPHIHKKSFPYTHSRVKTLSHDESEQQSFF